MKIGPSTPSAPLTMTDVARKAGVSQKTVSRVINNEPYVSEELRERVRAAIAALNYVPDFAARSLAGARSYTVSILLDNPSPNYTMKLLAGCYRACREHNYQLQLDNLDELTYTPAIVERLDQIVRAGRVDGFVLTPPVCDDPQVLDLLEARGLPYLRIAPVVDPGRSAAVSIDDWQAARTIADLFWTLGHRRIGLVNGASAHGASRARRGGFLERLRELDPEGTVPQADGHFRFEPGREAGLDLLDRHPELTAIFAANDDSAAGVMVACRQRGREVPQDISVCGFDDSWIAKTVWPFLTTVHQPIEEMAYCAVNTLLDRVLGGGMREMIVLDSALIQRDSVAPPPGMARAAPA